MVRLGRVLLPSTPKGQRFCYLYWYNEDLRMRKVPDL